MPLNLESTDYLPHIDADLQTQEREAILTQIRAEIPPHAANALHPSIPAAYEPQFSPLIEAELARVVSKGDRAPGTGIDVSRYEASALEAPARTSPHSDERDPELLIEWRQTLQRAYGLKTYLDGRTTNLSLLETYGKNAWLIGNAQLEDEVRSLERELTELKRQVEELDEQRRRKQDAVKGEMAGLEESWRRGVRGIVEVQLATDDLKQEILRRKRAGATAVR